MPTDSSDSTPRVTVPLDWNEVLIARFHEGRLTCWTAWRRSLEAFTNPRLWEDPALWAQHFTEQPASAGWGFEGYGLVAVDMDQRRLWSIQDYQVPGDFHPPMDSLIVENPHEHYAGLRALLAQPDLWARARLKTQAQDSSPSQDSHVSGLTLADVLDPGMGVDEAFERLTIKRGMLRVKGQNYLVFNGTIDMPGWTVATDRGQEEPTFTLSVLQALHDAGWPAPDWINVHEEIGEFFEELDDPDADDLDTIYATLKTSWPLDGQPALINPTPALARRSPRRP